MTPKKTAKSAVRKTTAKRRKTAGRRVEPRTRRDDSFLVQIKAVDLGLDLSLSGARDALAFLKGTLEANEGSGQAQLRLDARDLNAIYVYLSPRQLKKLVARFAVLELDEVAR
jgi:hypothetical protein